MAINRDRNNNTRQRTRTVFVPVGGGGSNIETEELSVSENGTYEAGKDKAYSKVTVKVTEPLGTVKIAETGTKFAYSSFSEVPEWADFEGVTDMNKMFYACQNLSTIPEIDSSKVTDMTLMFAECKNITAIPNIDTSMVVYGNGMFRNCSSLTSIPHLNTGQLSALDEMFYGCSSLISIPQIDTSQAYSMYETFYGCTSLTTIPQLDLTKCSGWDGLNSTFYNCIKLQSVPEWDVSNVKNMFNIFYGCKSLTNLGGFVGLQIALNLSPCSGLTSEAIMNVINKAADVTASPKTLTLGSTNIAKLTEAQIAVATNKGWTLA